MITGEKDITLKALNNIYEEMTGKYGLIDTARATYAHIINLMVAEFYDEGLEVFKKHYHTSNRQNPLLNLRIMLFYSQTMLHKKEYSKLVNALDGLVNDFRSEALFNNYAIALTRCGQINVAIAYLKQAVKINPTEQIKRNFEILARFTQNT